MAEAHGGTIGGAGTPTGEKVIVRLDDRVLSVFTETGEHRFPWGLVEEMSLQPHPGPTGTSLVVRAPRHGIAIPVFFEGRQFTRINEIIGLVLSGRDHWRQHPD